MHRKVRENSVSFAAYKGLEAFPHIVVHIAENEIAELYIDPFFVNQGIGSKLMEFAMRQMHCDYLWVLEKNAGAIRFYQRHGFVLTEEKKYQEGTPEFIIKMKL